jgi:cytochrome c-type biogenesis protein CcmE
MTDLTPRPVDESGPHRSRRILPMLVLAVVFAAGGVILTQFLTSAVDYYCNADEIGQRVGCDEDRRLRIQGTVEDGTVAVERGVTSFVITFNQVSVPVRYDGEPGGIFKECIPVVVHGQFDQGIFRGDRVEVKHSNEYVAVNSDRLTEAEYEGCATGPT